MRRFFAVLILGLAGSSAVQAQGLLVPTHRDVPPLTLSGHEVKVAIDDQVAVTHVVQTFRNPTSRALEATYIFPVPKGASVKKFTMWVDGKEVPGELVEADKARTIYTDIVNRTKDPGLLEYMGNNLLKVRVFPVPANGEQKLTVSYTSLAQKDNGTIEYIYPLKADGNAHRSLEKFTFEATIKDQQPVQSVYSPTHAINVRRPSDREAVVEFEGEQETLDKDFQLYYTAAAKDVGLTTLVHRVEGKDGHFMLLISPRAELSQTQQVPRDVVFVLDTSGSMAGKRIEQARKALNFCLRNLKEKDRFGMIHFATTVTKYQDKLESATSSQIERAQAWVNNLEAIGSTNIAEALKTALEMRSQDGERNFTIVFFTDGQPTIGETDPQKIVKNVLAKNTANTRIFTFGVGDDVNAVLLDQLAEKTRSVATYMRESEDIEAKVSNFYGKISHPVMTNLKVTARQQSVVEYGWFFGWWRIMPDKSHDVTWKEIYPQQLPDLFHGSQLVVLGQYNGQGHATVTLTGMVGDEKKEFTYDVNFPKKTGSDKSFVEDLWARRKVGYLLDQIRVNGESKEVKDEVISLARKYGITTPYTSYLVVPDVAPRTVAQPVTNRIQFAPVIVAPAGTMDWSSPRFDNPSPPPGYGGPVPSYAPVNGEFAPTGPSYGTSSNGGRAVSPGTTAPSSTSGMPASAAPDWANHYRNHGYQMYSSSGQNALAGGTVQSGKEGVDLSLALNEMRTQSQISPASARQAAGRKCLNLNGIWIDEGFNPKGAIVKIKAQSEAYFRLLERHPQMKEVLRLGNRVVWVTPSQTALVIDVAVDEERLSDEAIDRLFVAKK